MMFFLLLDCFLGVVFVIVFGGFSNMCILLLLLLGHIFISVGLSWFTSLILVTEYINWSK